MINFRHEMIRCWDDLRLDTGILSSLAISIYNTALTFSSVAYWHCCLVGWRWHRLGNDETSYLCSHYGLLCHWSASPEQGTGVAGFRCRWRCVCVNILVLW